MSLRKKVDATTSLTQGSGLVAIRNKLVRAEKRSPLPDKASTKKVLLSVLDEFLSITDRTDEELLRETKRLEKAFNDAGFCDRFDGNIEASLENAYKKTLNSNKKEMILKMLLILGDGRSGFLSVTLLNPKCEDYEFTQKFFQSLSREQIREYINHIVLPNENNINALLELPDRDFVIKTISDCGTDTGKPDCQRLLLFMIEKLAPNIDFSTVTELFEVASDDSYGNGDFIRSIAEVMREKYPAAALEYFKQLAEDTGLNNEINNFSLRMAGIRNYVYLKREESVLFLRKLLLDENNVNLVNRVLPFLFINKKIFGTKGQEVVVDIIAERSSREETSLELYWLIRHGCFYTPNAEKMFTTIDCYGDLFKMIFSKIPGIDKNLRELDEIDINSITIHKFGFVLVYPENSTVKCLIERLGIKRLAGWALEGSNETLTNNALTVLASSDDSRFSRFMNSGSTVARKLKIALGMSS